MYFFYYIKDAGLSQMLLDFKLINLSFGVICFHTELQ